MFKLRFLAVVAAPLLLAGCGEGYELIKTNAHFPYGNARTAGSGYAYVLAKMLPEKELKLETVKDVTREWKPEVMAVLPKSEPVEPADQIFLDDGKK